MRTIETGKKSEEVCIEMLGIIGTYFKDLDMNIAYEDTDRGYRIFLEKESYNSIDYLLLSEAIIELFVEYYLEGIIVKRLKDIYPRDNIIPNKRLIESIKMELRASRIYKDEKQVIRNSLIDYLDENKNLNLDGYLVFRLYEYKYILDIAIDKVVSKVMEEKRLEEFLNMIQYLVNIQEPKIELLNLIIEDGNFKFTNIDNKKIGLEVIAGVKKELRDMESTKADVLLSSLIIMAPRRLIVHYVGDKRSLLIQAINEIFKDRVKFCSGCNICDLNRELEF